MNSVQFQSGMPFAQYVSGLLASFLDTAVVFVGAGQCQNDTATALMTVRRGGELAVDLTTNGPGGLDTGSPPVSSWLYLYLIAGPTVGVNAIASLSGVGPLLPAGYTTYRRLDTIRTNPAAEIIPFAKTGTGRDRRTDWQSVETFMQLLAGGTLTTGGLITCTAALPPSCTRIIGEGLLTAGGVAPCIANIGIPGFTSGSPIAINANGGQVMDAQQLQLTTNLIQVLGYQVTGASASLTFNAQGYQDTL